MWAVAFGASFKKSFAKAEGMGACLEASFRKLFPRVVSRAFPLTLLRVIQVGIGIIGALRASG